MSHMPINILHLLLFIAVQVIFVQSQGSNTGAILGCDLQTEVTSKGFSVSYYHYPMIPRANSPGCFDFDSTYQSVEYQHGGYETFGGGKFGSSSGVTNLNFRYNGVCDTCCKVTNGSLPANYNYQSQITLSNFSMLITGYFFAPKTGTYSFILNYVDDLAYVNIGAGNAFGCCDKEKTVSNPGSYVLSMLSANDQNTVTSYLLGCVLARCVLARTTLARTPLARDLLAS